MLHFSITPAQCEKKDLTQRILLYDSGEDCEVPGEENERKSKELSLRKRKMLETVCFGREGSPREKRTRGEIALSQWG